jgi:hypothetical protein
MRFVWHMSWRVLPANFRVQNTKDLLVDYELAGSSIHIMDKLPHKVFLPMSVQTAEVDVTTQVAFRVDVDGLQNI